VSGNTKNNVQFLQWGIYEWYQFVSEFMERMPGRKLVIIGAEFDRAVVDELELLFVEWSAVSFVGERPEQVMYILDNAEFFIGYQSGLGIMADNMQTPQLMMYFSHLDKMQYSWCQPKHEQSVFWADTFDRQPADVLKSLTWEPK
jgi:ADP-heptose:LPS heptosyltransferase